VVKLDASATLPLSVIIPLADHRGHAVEAVRSWTRDQTVTPCSFEVVLVTDGGERSVEAQVSALLRPGDRLLTVEQGSLHDGYNAGARAARGAILLFTESHVKAAPDCIDQVLRHFAHSADDCIAVGSDGLNENPFAGQEQTVYEEALPGRIASGWNLCTVRGFAVKRARFEQAGGFASRYGHFSELLLGAKLAWLGAKLNYAPHARVSHFNSGTVGHFRRELAAFGREEIRFRAEHPDSPLLSYLGHCRLWDQRHDLNRGPAFRRTACAVGNSIRQVLSGNFKQAGRSLEEACRFLPCAALGPAWPRLWAATVVSLAIVRMAIFSLVQSWRYRAFRAMWQGQIRLGRAQAVEELLLARP
jgi:hypothetical protein